MVWPLLCDMISISILSVLCPICIACSSIQLPLWTSFISNFFVVCSTGMLWVSIPIFYGSLHLYGMHFNLSLFVVRLNVWHNFQFKSLSGLPQLVCSTSMAWFLIPITLWFGPSAWHKFQFKSLFRLPLLYGIRLNSNFSFVFPILIA